MRTLLRTAAVLLLVLWARATEATELFHLVVDPTGPTPFSDATGRHGILTGGVADVDPDPPVVPGSVIASSMLTPDGSNAAFFTGAWLEITTANPSFASDFLFAANQNLTVTYWFKSLGNGAYNAPPALPRYWDRMHTLGFGSTANNLDVDFGDGDPAPTSNPPDETACWTYFGGGGQNNVIDSDTGHDRNYYLDDQWHHYRLVRDANLVTVYLDGNELGTTVYPDPLGSDSAAAHNYIGRASIFTESSPNVQDPFPWFGYIGGFRVFDEAVPPGAPCGPAPKGGCGQAGKSLLLLKNNATDDTKDKLVWKWLKGAETSLEDLGVPTGTTNYTLCLYAGTASASIALLSGPKWQPAGKKGYKYKDKSGTPDGAQKALLKSGDAGKAKALVKGKGTNLPDALLPGTLGPMLPLPVTAQLVNDTNSTCFEATYNTAIKNDAKQFKAKAP